MVKTDTIFYLTILKNLHQLSSKMWSKILVWYHFLLDFFEKPTQKCQVKYGTIILELKCTWIARIWFELLRLFFFNIEFVLIWKDKYSLGNQVIKTVFLNADRINVCCHSSKVCWLTINVMFWQISISI